MAAHSVGVILFGGKGTRLRPVTFAVNKHFLPIYNKPLCFYPLSILMLMGVRDYVFVVNQCDKAQYFALFGDGSAFGISIRLVVQKEPLGIPDAILLARDFVPSDSDVIAALGDNVLVGSGLSRVLSKGSDKTGATVFTVAVRDPERFGVLVRDELGNVEGLVEKPSQHLGDEAVVGLYIFDSTVWKRLANLTPSDRGELEVVDVLTSYLSDGRLTAVQMPRGIAWFDAGTFDSYLEASEFMRACASQSVYSVGCIDEIAFRNNWIDSGRLLTNMDRYGDSDYCEYLESEVLKHDSSAVE